MPHIPEFDVEYPAGGEAQLLEGMKTALQKEGLSGDFLYSAQERSYFDRVLNGTVSNTHIFANTEAELDEAAESHEQKGTVFGSMRLLRRPHIGVYDIGKMDNTVSVPPYTLTSGIRERDALVAIFRVLDV